MGKISVGSLLIITLVIISLMLTACTTKPVIVDWDDVMKTVEGDENLPLYYEEYGTGDPILLIHGFGNSTFTWRYCIPSLSQNYRVIVVDLKGFGHSPKPLDSQYSIADQAALICRFIRQHDLSNLTIIGHSFGGGVALLTSVYFMTETPQRLQRLILLDSAAYKQSLPFFIKIPSMPLLRNIVFAFTSNKFLVRSSLKQAFYDDTKIEPSAVSTYAEPLNTPNGRHALIEVTKHLANLELGDVEEKFREIDIPTLIIWGRHDTVTPLSIGQRLEKAIPHSRLVVLDGCGHIPHEEVPERTLAVIQEFFTAVSSEIP